MNEYLLNDSAFLIYYFIANQLIVCTKCIFYYKTHDEP